MGCMIIEHTDECIHIKIPTLDLLTFTQAFKVTGKSGRLKAKSHLNKINHASIAAAIRY